MHLLYEGPDCRLKEAGERGHDTGGAATTWHELHSIDTPTDAGGLRYPRSMKCFVNCNDNDII